MSSGDFNSEASTPGQLLRRHREKLNLSIKDIASITRLHIDIIKAVEEDSYGGIPSPLYTKGYLKNYARIVNVDAERVISLYNATAQTELPKILPEGKVPSQVSSSDNPVKILTYLISFTLVLLLLIWYQSNFNVEDEEQILLNPSEIGAEAAPALSIKAPDQKISGDTGTVAPAQVKVDNFSDENHDAAVLQSKAGDQGDQMEPALPSFERMDNVMENVPVATGYDLIHLVFPYKSWVQIYDVHDQRLFFGFADPGEKYLIKGKAPFRLLLGFAHGANVEFNDKPIDITPYVRKNIARFTLPES